MATGAPSSRAPADMARGSGAGGTVSAARAAAGACACPASVLPMGRKGICLGFPARAFLSSALVAFRPQRLALHELLIRVTADFAVPDGTLIGDLGINFREIASLLFERHLLPETDAIAAVYERARRELRDAMDAALAGVMPEHSPLDSATKRPGSRLFARIARRRAAPIPVDRGWGPRQIAECERLAGSSVDPRQKIVYRTLARVMSALVATQGHAWGTRELIASVASNMAGNEKGREFNRRTGEPMLLRASRSEGYPLLPRQERPVVINTKGPSASGKSTLRP